MSKQSFAIAHLTGAVSRATRFSSIPCPVCAGDTVHYVGKCVHCHTVNELIPDLPTRKTSMLFGKGEAA